MATEYIMTPHEAEIVAPDESPSADSIPTDPNPLAAAPAPTPAPAHDQPPPHLAAGLRFECQPGCGACCARPGEVRVTRADTKGMARELGLSVSEFRRQYVINDRGALRLVDGRKGACPMLGENYRCRVYAARPVQCRTYPFWPEVVADSAAWEWEAIRCPGIGKGRLYAADEIIALCAADQASTHAK